MEVRAKKALGQHFLTDQRIAQAIVDALHGPCEALEVGMRQTTISTPRCRGKAMIPYCNRVAT